MKDPYLYEPEPPLIMTFGRFLSGKFPDTNHGLYIVWRGKQALYVGISKFNIWDRWFTRDGCHISIYADGKWDTLYSSTIGRVIAKHRPASLRWKIELRDYEDLNKAEKELIKELHPLFNIVYRPNLTEKERKIYRRLQKDELTDRLKNPAESLINYDDDSQNLTSAPCDMIDLHL